MKNLLLFVFLNVVLNNVNLKEQCGFKNIEIDSCCITVEVLENEYPRWSVKIDNLTTIWSMDVESVLGDVRGMLCFGYHHCI